MYYKNFLPIHYFEDNIFNQMTKNNQNLKIYFKNWLNLQKNFQKLPVARYMELHTYSIGT